MSSILPDGSDSKSNHPREFEEHSTDLTPGFVWSESQLAVLRDLLAPLYKAQAAVKRCEALADELDHEGVVMLFHGPHNRNQFITARIRAALSGDAR